MFGFATVVVFGVTLLASPTTADMHSRESPGAIHVAQAPEVAKAAIPAAPPARIADVAWLQGYWVGEGMGGSIEDAWLPPRAGMILGAFRLVKSDGTPGRYQLFAIEEHEGSLQLVVKHFTPDFVGLEEKDKALRLRLTRIAPHEAVFGGVAFQRDGERLSVKVTLRGKDGARREEILTLAKQPL